MMTIQMENKAQCRLNPSRLLQRKEWEEIAGYKHFRQKNPMEQEGYIPASSNNLL